MKKLNRAFFGVLGVLLMSPLSQANSPVDGFVVGEPNASWNFTQAGLIPVQSGGRIKPLDTFAREVVLFLTNRRSFQNWDPVDLIFSMMTAPDAWQDQAFIRIDRQDVKRQLLLDEKRVFFSPRELMENPVVFQYYQELSVRSTVTRDVGANPRAERVDHREEELKTVVNRLTLFQGMVSGESWRVIPVVGNEAWKTLAEVRETESLVRNHFFDLIRSYFSGDRSQFERNAVLTQEAVKGEIEAWSEVSQRKLFAESTYNRTRPFQVTFWIYLASGLLWAGALMMKSTSLTWIALWGTLIGFLIHSIGFMLRIYISGRAPVTNMYETVVFLAFGVLIFGLIIYSRQRNKIVMAAATVVAAFAIMAADASPAVMDPKIHPLVPVLRSNFWLSVHVITIMLGYAAFALSLGIGNVTLFQYIRQGWQKKKLPGFNQKVFELNQLTYRAVQFGVILLAAGTILGGIWADYSWGRFWGWDPKETWALIALLLYLAVLHGRFTGWVGQFSFAALSVACFLGVVMAWYGVNYVLGVGLHSYGFASGGTEWVTGFSLVQLLYVGVAYGAFRSGKRVREAEFKKGSHDAGVGRASGH
jgi:cytochrome c-type biogenesis protein CcsB